VQLLRCRDLPAGRDLETVGLRERDIKVINTSDADIVAPFAAPGTTATVA